MSRNGTIKETMAVHFEKVTIIGVGLIGGSLAIALREGGLCGNIVGVGRGVRNLDTAKRLSIIDSFTTDPAEGVKGSSLVVVAVPVLSTAAVVKTIAPALEKGCILTDVGSVKQALIKETEPLVPEGVHFVPGHPIAGTEDSGAAAAFSGLFRGRKTILTPTPGTDRAALSIVREVWESAGSVVVEMDPAIHDTVLAAVSHLPHMIAYSLVNTVADIDDRMGGKGGDILAYSAGGFRDFTRIASSSPGMWSDICAMNRDAIVGVIEDFQKTLEELRRSIEACDTERIIKSFERSKRVRDSIKD